MHVPKKEDISKAATKYQKRNASGTRAERSKKGHHGEDAGWWISGDGGSRGFLKAEGSPGV